MTVVELYLDWTPNCNHAGFFVALAKGFYTDHGISDVSIISPHSDSYKTTPASHIETLKPGTLSLAIAPSETVISYNTSPPARPKPPIKAVAAILQQDTSAIVTLKSSGISSPRQLEGKKYASYGARYEGRIVQEMIKSDGGSGDYVEVADLSMLGLWETVLKGEADATWVFMAWEGVEAKMKDVELNAFKLADYGIPYGYSPVLIAHPDVVAKEETALASEQQETLRSFLKASAIGFQFAAEHPEETAKLLCEQVSRMYPDLQPPLEVNMMTEACKTVAPHLLLDSHKWGDMSGERWDAFLDWLSEKGLLTTLVQSRVPEEGVSTSLDKLRGGEGGEVIPRGSVASEQLFTNEFLS
jgi:ABC-type nitrate/sulfonate/bicarbonate transport system substrate-binding protein